MQEIFISVSGIPPSLNHYVRHCRGGHFRTEEAESFAQKVALAALRYRGMEVEAEEVEIHVTLGPKQRGDLDNFCKVPLDSLVRCGVIRSDAAITRLVVEKYRSDNPHTDIFVRWE
jgi:Holliday junction resolvase RusA-like endonuclease